MSFASSNAQSWTRNFSQQALRRGQQYFEEGRVLDFQFDESAHVIFARFKDSLRVTFDVEIDLEPTPHGARFLVGHCECFRRKCSHLAAVLYAAEEICPGLFGDSQPGTNGLARLGLPPSLLEWLGRIKRTGAPSSATAKPKASPDQISYLLNVRSNSISQALFVGCFKSRPRKNGGQGKRSRYTLNNCLNSSPAAFVQPVDIRIALLITRGQRTGYLGYSHEAALSGPDAGEILELFLKTGRCFWKEFSEKPLQPAPARPGTPVWRRDQAGSLHPHFQTVPECSAILPLNPPWYIDGDLCGPLKLEMPPEAAQAWLQAPPIGLRETAALAQAFQHTELAALSLPAPEVIPVVRPDPVPPVPCLKLATVKLNWWDLPGGVARGHLDKTPVHYASLTFDYHGAQIPWNAGDQTLEQFDGKQLLVIQRDKNAEKQVLQVLQESGFLPDGGSFGYDCRRKLAGSFILVPSKNDHWFQFGLQTLPKLRALGWRIEIDPSFDLNVLEVTDWYAGAEPDKAGDWFDIELGVQSGEEKIDLLPVLLHALQSQGDQLALETLRTMPPEKLVPVRMADGRILPFPAGRLREILSVLIELFDPNSLGKTGRLKIPRMRAAELAGLSEKDQWKWFGGETLRELAQKLKNFDGIHHVDPPAELRAQLRGYQQDGLNWLQFLREYELAGILADDMGLGKTVQTLAHLLVEKNAGRLDRPALVIAPTSLMVNWRQEAEKFAPSLRTLVLHGADRKNRFGELPDHDLVLTTYPLLPRDAAYLLAAEFHTVILDEAQFIKNPKTQWAQLVCQLQARHRLCLTGTPMENHLGELWSLFNFLLPGLLGDETRFRAVFRNPIEKGKNEDRRQILARRVAPFLLRRRKEQVVKELPPKTEIVQNVELNGAQRDLYESIRLAMHQRVREEIQKKGMSRSHIIILDALLKLRQVCCDPRLLPLESARKVEESAKLDLLMDLLPEMLSEGRRILLFSQFTSMLELIEKRLQSENIHWVKLTGSTTDRATPVNRFQNGEVPLFLISLKAGGTGLNLTAADTVIHYDPWWNPAVENQATDRAHRIGQDKPVFVYKLLTVGTVEEKIVTMQARKRELVESLLNEGAGRSLDLNAEDLDFLFSPLS